MQRLCLISFFFFFNDTATSEIYTLSLHDALPISSAPSTVRSIGASVDVISRTPIASACWAVARLVATAQTCRPSRSEEHTSELQSHSDLVCRLLLEKKKKKKSR